MTAKKTIRTAAILMALAALPAMPAPALAQSFGFGFGFHYDDDRPVRFPRLCILTDRGLRDAIEDQGYENIYLNVPIGRYVQARASRGNWVYLLKVNACTGTIVDRERLRRR
jgi:hypothetical protein